MQHQMDKKNITIIIGVVIVLTVVLGVGIYLLVKQAPKIESQTKDDNSERIYYTTKNGKKIDLTEEYRKSIIN